MATKTKAQIQSDSNVTYLDNTAGQITPSAVRSLNTDWIDSIIFTSQTSSLTFTSASYALTASVVLGSITSASLATQNLYTASVSNNVVTFTKGDTTTFSLTVATGSGITTISSSYAATASLLLGSVVSASFALTASSVNTLNQPVTTTGSFNLKGTQLINGDSLIFYNGFGTSNRTFQSEVSRSAGLQNNILSIVVSTSSSTGSIIVSGSGNYLSISTLPANLNINEGSTFGFSGTNGYVTVLPSITGSNPNVNVAGVKNNRYVPAITNSNVNGQMTIVDNRISQTTAPLTLSNSSFNSTATFTISSQS